jgi:LemA protein
MEMITLVILGAFVLFALFLIGTYNSLVSLRNKAKNAFANIDVHLKKRYDLIPNLIATVQKYMEHEKDTLLKVTEMRTKAMSGGISDDEKVKLDGQISSAMRGIMVSVERYPELKANENFNQLQRTLNEVEEQLSASRRSYNMTVTDYNTSLETFPTVLFAGMLNFKPKSLFEVSEAERKNVDVKSLFNS